MVATAATASRYPISSPQTDSGCKTSGKLGGAAGTVDMLGIKTKSASLGALQVKSNTQAPLDPFGFGRYVHDIRVFRQNLCIRSYEIGVDRTVSMETIMNHLQETVLNLGKTTGLLGVGSGSSVNMCAKNLFWVVAKVQVRVDRYPTWGTVVQAETSLAASGKNGVRQDSLLRDCKTGETLTRASINLMLMNKETRRLSKIPDESLADLQQYFVDKPPIVDEDNKKLPKLDENTTVHVRNGLISRWSDLDGNQHVNNVKYIDWILESVPKSIIDKYEIASMTLEYRRECREDSLLQSLTSVLGNHNDGIADSGHVHCRHLLRLEGCGGEIVKGMTEWRLKYGKRVTTQEHWSVP